MDVIGNINNLIYFLFKYISFIYNITILTSNMSNTQTKKELNSQMIQTYVDKLVEMVKYNRDKLKNEEEYRKLTEEKRLEHIQKHPDFQDFYRSFPSVTTYAISRGVYSTKVFKKYVQYKFTKTPTPEERAELMNNPEGQKVWGNKFYATYVKWLYADKNPHCPQNELDRVYTETLNALNQETKQFFQTYEKEKEKFDIEKEELNKERKEELKQLFKQRLENKLNETK